MWASIILSPRQISCIATGTFRGHEIIRQRNVSSTKVLKMERRSQAHCEHPELLWRSLVGQILMHKNGKFCLKFCWLNKKMISRSACLYVSLNWACLTLLLMSQRCTFISILSSLYFQCLLWLSQVFSRDVFKFNYWQVSFSEWHINGQLCQ